MSVRRLILVVDDEMVNRKIIEKILSEEYDLLAAENGAQAMELLQAHGQEISVVLLDIVMPVMDGYEVLRRMRESDELAVIPVIVSSQKEGDEAELAALEMGAADFMAKPYKPDMIKRRVKNLIKLRESAYALSRLEHDQLTGLYNKDAFCRRAKERLGAEPAQRFDLIAVDIERFELVNDLYGKQEGDKLLVYVAQQIEYNASAGLCGRLYSDVFACLMPHGDEVMQRHDRIVEAIARYPLNLRLNIKCGVYPVEDASLPVETMCDRALLTVNSIKGAFGKNVAYYDDSLRMRIIREQAITDHMQAALEKGEFIVYYQPKYALATEKIAGAEALVRWMHPEKGFLPPGEFIPIFERNGFITRLDRYVWERVCADVRDWLDAGNIAVPVSVNVSRADLYVPDLPDILTGLTQKYRLEPGMLHLEITESAYTQNAEQLIKVVRNLKARGFILEMDDFGTGYSSLNMLAQLPIHILKLDMRFLQTQSVTPKGNILSFVISLARWLNLQVVAEGVETAEQIRVLRNMDCDFVQGYYYAKPMPLSEFQAHLLAAGVNELPPPAPPQPEVTLEAHVELARGAGDGILLIVDDVELNRAVLKETFQKDFTVKEADNGQVALDFIYENAERIAIILLDLIMPVMDGYQLLDKLKRSSRTANIPVVITSQAGEDSESQALGMGALDFIPKPYNPVVARQRVCNVIAFSRMRQLGREQELVERLEEMERRIRYDALTGLMSRTEVEERVDEFFAGGRRQGALIMLDLDGFKRVNDTLGHRKGDEVLRLAAQRLRALFRGEDLLGRIGGDEFVIFLPRSLSAEQLRERMSALLGALRMEFEGVRVSCSAGVSICPEDGEEYKLLVDHADKALLCAKRAGKDGWQLYGGSLADPPALVFRSMEWLLDETSDVVFVCGRESHELLYVNKAGCDLAGKTRAEAVGANCHQFFWDRGAPCRFCDKGGATADGFCETEVAPWGDERRYLMRGKLIDWNGTPAILQYLQDVTVCARVRRDLTQALRQAGVCQWTLELDEKREEDFPFVPGTPLDKDRLHPEDRDTVLSLVKRMDAGEQAVSCQVRARPAGGGPFIAYRIDYTRQEENGRPPRAVGTALPAK
jgi:diguanylate cyclase (GGDEF)-like protein